MALDTIRVKPYVAPEEGTPPLHYYTDQDLLIQSNKYVIVDIVPHATVGPGRLKHLEWEVKYRGCQETEFSPHSYMMSMISGPSTTRNIKLTSTLAAFAKCWPVRHPIRHWMRSLRPIWLCRLHNLRPGGPR